jgi:outer membrane protein
LNNKKSRWSRGAQACALAVLLCAFTGVAAPVHCAEPNLDEAQKLVQGGRAADAYSLLAPHEDQLAGDVRYDYLLGIAALDSGKPDKATLAFERVLAVDPNFAGARLDMARAYYHLGDLTRARAEFDTVLSQNPPPAARATVNRYLDLMREAEEAKKTVKVAYTELTYGRDSNVNNSTSQSVIPLPLYGILIPLDARNIKRGDTYGMLGVGGDIVHETGGGYAVFAGGDLRYRANNTADQFDYKSANGRTGFAWSNDAEVVRVTLSGERYYLDNARNRSALAMSGDWRHGYNASTFTNIFGAYTRYRFDSTDVAVNNFDQYLLGVGGLKLYHEGRSAVNLSLFAGREDDTNGRADGNKDIRGVRLGGVLNFHERGDLFVSVGAQRGTYDRQNVAFMTTRADNQYDAVAGVVWRIDRAWALRPQVLYIHNDSNIPIYAYKRSDVSVTLRRDFR